MNNILWSIFLTKIELEIINDILRIIIYLELHKTCQNFLCVREKNHNNPLAQK